MAFPANLTSVLTGASIGQLRRWSRTGLLRPEIQRRPALYSFQDLVALRTFVRMRKEIPLQRIRKAVAKLRDFDLTEHPAKYQLHTDGKSVFFVEDERSVDLVRKPGQRAVMNLEDVFAPFRTRRGADVVDFLRPRANLEVKEARMGGWPTIKDTRVGFDSVARLLDGDDIAPEDVQRFYPNVTPEGAVDAKDLYDVITARRKAAS